MESMAVDNKKLWKGYKMADIYRYIFLPIAIAILFIIPELIIDTWLYNIGVSRKSKQEIIIVTFFLVFVKQIFYENLSWWFYGIMLMLVMTLAAHRSDLGETMKNGRWWWIPKEKKREKR